jgi:FIMAH domain
MTGRTALKIWRRLLLATIGTVSVLWGAPSEAAIVSSTGDVDVLKQAPASVVIDALTDDHLTRVFLERTVTLAANLMIDNTATGNYPDLGWPGVNLTTGSIVASYCFHFDPPPNSRRVISDGSVTFDRDIIGVVFRDQRLSTTDATLRAPGTLYPTSAGRGGVETVTSLQFPPTDSFSISQDRRTFTFHFEATEIDQMRVIVRGVPFTPIYWTLPDAGTIRRTTLNGTSQALVTGLTGPDGLAVDDDAGKLYWTTGIAGAIQRTNVDGTGLESVVTGQLADSPQSIALDVAAGQMYWTNRVQDYIFRANLDGQNPVPLFFTGQSVVGIALDVAGGRIFWSQEPTNKIYSTADGGAQWSLVIDSFPDGLPQTVALDLAGGKLYWAELASPSRIRRVNLDGSAVETLVTLSGSERVGVALDVLRGTMYFWEDDTGTIWRATLDGGEIEAVRIAAGERVGSIAVGRTAASVTADPTDGVTVSDLPRAAGEAGVAATLTNNTAGSGSATLTVENFYNTNPGTPNVIDVGGQYVDLRVDGADLSDVVVAKIYYPSTITGTTETLLQLRYFNSATLTWNPVLSSGGALPEKVITNDLDGTVSGGRFTVTFDDTSTPLVTELVGTVFTSALSPAEGVRVLNDRVAALDLNSGQLQSLRVKLASAEKSIAGGQKQSAARALDTFISEVQGLGQATRITAATADELIRFAQSVIAAM